MNPFQYEATCDVCDEVAKCTASTASHAWNTRFKIRHSDPSVCADNIERNAKKLEDNMNRYQKGGTVNYKGELAIISNVFVGKKPKFEVTLEILRLSGEVKKIKPSELDG